ncbi:MAG: hypothetical protein RL768_2370 [Nitrospirota bacterium]|jgi:hypothetical protein
MRCNPSEERTCARIVRYVSLSWLAVLLWGLWSLDRPLALAEALTRGPYLQVGTATTQIIRWRTDSATDSQVRIGTAPGSLNQTISVSDLTTEHIVLLTGLSPSTTYYYAVGSAATNYLAGNDAAHLFKTPPLPGTAHPTRIWVLGDAGTAGPTGSNANQTAVRTAYESYLASAPGYTDLILMLGDNAYNSGTDAEYQNAVFNMYPNFLRQTNLWSTVGNHDTAQATNPDITTVPYFQIFSLPTAGEAGGVASGTEKYYSFDHGHIHFVCLDSMTSSRSTTGAMLTWLKQDLASNTQPWVIAFWHHPPYSKGSHNSDTEAQLIEMRTNVLPVLESFGVDLVLSGHSHSYERSYLIGGHYGLSGTFDPPSMIKFPGGGRPGIDGAYPKSSGADQKRAVYAVAGSSGQTSGGALNHPAMFISLNVLGSLLLDVNGSTLNAKFINNAGVVADSFTMSKGTWNNAAPTVTISDPANGAGIAASSPVTLTATAGDSDGSIDHVDFYSNSKLIGTDPSAPYNISWTESTPGMYGLTAKAVDNQGTMSTSAVVSATVGQAAVPAAPTNLRATLILTTQIDMSWSDSASNETGFDIERSIDNKSFFKIGSTGSNLTTFSATGLAKNKTYYFRVRAIGSGGNSTYSNVLKAKTLR